MSVKYALRLLEWYTGDDHGVSSEAIAGAMSGAVVKRPWTPSDGDDLGRCLRLLALFPEWTSERFAATMSTISPQWKLFAEFWPDLVACFAEEVGPDLPRGRWAPRTYDLIKAIEDRARQMEPHP